MKGQIIASVVVVFAFIQISAQNSVSTRWRGPSGNGTYKEVNSKLLKEWPLNGPEILWTAKNLGQGFSSPVFANGKIYVTGMVNQNGYVFILSENGKLERKINYGPEFYESYPGTRSTPTIAGDLLYVLSGLGRLICIDLEKGTAKWEKNLFTDFGGSNIRWGVTESVVVDGEVVYATPGGRKNNVIALNRFTGKLIWSCTGKGQLSAYCTPLLFTHEGKKILATHTASTILGIDAANGELLWTYHHPNQWSVHANTPLYNNGMLLCTSGYGHGSLMLKLTNGGNDVERVWFNSKLDNRMGGMILHDNHIYSSGDKNRSWQCVNWFTGETLYEASDIAKGVVISSEGMLYCYSERGELALVKATPEGFNIKGKTKVTLGSAQHWAHPVIHKGKLFLRHGDVLIAYNISE